MPPLTTLRAFFAYNDWARDKILGAAAALDDARLDRAIDMGPGSLRAILIHLWAAERFWLSWWTTGRDPDRRPEDDHPGIDELRARFEATAAQRNAFLDARGEAGEAHPMAAGYGRTGRYPLGDMMLHVCDHGVHHRAQAVNMLRHLGVEPPKIDYLHHCLADPLEIAYDGETLLECFRYGDRAVTRLIDIAAGLDDDALDRPFDMGLGTLRRTLIHVRNAEQGWLGAWGGDPAASFRSLPEDAAIGALASAFAETAAARNAFIAGLDAAGFARSVDLERPGRTATFRVGDALIQLVGHGTHHRAQAVNMLRHLGVAGAGYDYIAWLDENAEAATAGAATGSASG